MNKIGGKMPKGRIAQDWTGQTFNNCKIIEPITSKAGYVKWKILCHCGNIFEAEPSKLKQGVYQSCGCYRIIASRERMLKQKIWESQTKKYINKKYNNCIVIEPIDNNKVRMHDYFKVKCFCGNFFSARVSNLHSGAVRSCGCLKSGKGLKEYHQKRKIENGLNPNIFYTERLQLLRNLFFIDDIKNIILLRDDYSCCNCSNKDNLFIHHIFPICAIMRKYKFSSLIQIYSIDNLITLCGKCHEEAHLNNKYAGNINISLQQDFINYIFEKNMNITRELYDKYLKCKSILDRKLTSFLIGKTI